jgi:putative phosphoesterase
MRQKVGFTMRIGVVSDTHDRTPTIENAITILREKQMELVIHCGDIESVGVVELFEGIPTHFVLGNWDGDWITGVNCGFAARSPDGRKRNDARLRQAIEKIGGRLHEPWGELSLCNKQIAWVHGNDRALLRDLEYSNCYDYLFYGHTHVAEQHRTGKTLVVNPGAMFKVEPKQFVIVDLEKGAIEKVVVE